MPCSGWQGEFASDKGSWQAPRNDTWAADRQQPSKHVSGNGRGGRPKRQRVSLRKPVLHLGSERIARTKQLEQAGVEGSPMSVCLRARSAGRQQARAITVHRRGRARAEGWMEPGGRLPGALELASCNCWPPLLPTDRQQHFSPPSSWWCLETQMLQDAYSACSWGKRGGTLLQLTAARVWRGSSGCKDTGTSPGRPSSRRRSALQHDRQHSHGQLCAAQPGTPSLKPLRGRERA